MRLNKNFSNLLLTWYDHYGRKHLPWQQNPTAYQVWLSEIMLQQTQVQTVIPYYQRFIAEFPNLAALAAASEDRVLHLWTGLGYYSRARRLLAVAKILVANNKGEFPDSLEALVNLPGIGRSTAGAILALGMQKKASILEGNVKRVLARVHRIEGWLGEASIQKQLWKLAEFYTPEDRVGAYTQAIMDLGAMVCTRTQPRCISCPVQNLCQAYQAQQVNLFPTPRLKKQLPVRQVFMLMFHDTEQAEVLLEKRPLQGIWGGLWGFPEQLSTSAMTAYCEQHWQGRIKKLEHWDSFRHTFSHYHLDITPVSIEVAAVSSEIREDQKFTWYSLNKPAKLGLAAPVKKLLNHLKQQEIYESTGIVQEV